MRNENGGGDVGYYVVQIDHPKRFKPCVVECEDVIAALGLDFFEGEAFKAIWRKGAQRTLGVGKDGNTALRDAQKVAHYGARCLALEEQRAGPLPEATDGRLAPLWTSHQGGPCPVAAGTIVEVLHRDGTPSGPAAAQPEGRYWSWLPGNMTHRDIMGYRVIASSGSEAPPTGLWRIGDYVKGKSGATYIFDGFDEDGLARLRNSGSVPSALLSWVSRP